MTRQRYDTLMSDVRDYTMIVVGQILYAIGFCVFILPHQIVIGGMTGVGTLVYFATGGLIPVAVTMYGCNIALLIAGFRMLGKTFLIRTIFGATGMSIFIGLIENYFMNHPALLQQTEMSIILGGILCGLGIGTIYVHNGTSGGSDIIAAMVTKKSNVSVGRILMMVDMTIVALTFFLPFNGTLEERVQESLPRIIYGWITIFVTVLDGTGWYTKNNVKILLVWCRKIESVTIFRIIKNIDNNAFIAQSNANGVYGKGFDTMKVKAIKKHNA